MPKPNTADTDSTSADVCVKATDAAPPGYMRNTLGHLVPVETIRDIDLARDTFVRESVRKAKQMATDIAKFKATLTGDMEAFLDLSAERYGVHLGGGKGNINLMSFDGRFRLTRDISERLEFDERLQAAKVLIDQCLREWTRDAGAELRTLIENAFQVDKKGRINSRRILALRRLDIRHPAWQRAMEAIGDAVVVTGSCQYFRLYERDENGEYHQICLDFSGA